MTSSVTVTAHLASTKRVKVSVKEHDNHAPDVYLRDGETTELSVYDDKSVTIQEVDWPVDPEVPQGIEAGEPE